MMTTPHDPSIDGPTGQTARTSTRRHVGRVAAWTTAAVIVLGGGLAAASASATPGQGPDPTADDAAWTERLHACLDGVAGSADSLERWVPACRERATSTAGL